MQDPTEALTLTEALDDLTRRGFIEHFTPMRGGLRGVDSGETFRADQMMITEYYRFEGASDPDDMSILYALETRTGVRGTLVDAFGTYSDPLVGDVIADIPLRRTVDGA